MKRHRTFIAINLPENIKEKLLRYKDYWDSLPARWSKRENIHLTLLFLGYLSDEEVSLVARVVKEVGSRHEPFSLKMERICYGPLEKEPPRMIWVELLNSSELTLLRKDLLDSLQGSGLKFFREEREFTPHITLARLRMWEWRNVPLEERPHIDERLDLSFEVNSFELMESYLKKKGPDYSVLLSVPLKYG